MRIADTPWQPETTSVIRQRNEYTRAAYCGREICRWVAGAFGEGRSFQRRTQRELLPRQWDLTFMEVDIKGKALFLKTIAAKEEEYRSDFRTVPDGLTLAEAADILTKQVMIVANR